MLKLYCVQKPEDWIELGLKIQQEVLDWMASIHKVHVIWVLPFTCAFLALYTQRSYYTVLQKK